MSEDEEKTSEAPVEAAEEATEEAPVEAAAEGVGDEKEPEEEDKAE